MEQSLAATLWRLAGLLALVFANGFFVAAEFSIVTVRKTRIDQLIAEGHRSARAVRRAVSAPDRYIAATQLGITMAALGLGWLAEPALASIFEPALFFLPLIALCSYSLLAFMPVLSFIRLAKIAENSTDYSVQNTARHALFLRIGDAALDIDAEQRPAEGRRRQARGAPGDEA